MNSVIYVTDVLNMAIIDQRVRINKIGALGLIV
jgi:hypothetical protein